VLISFIVKLIEIIISIVKTKKYVDFITDVLIKLHSWVIL